MSGVAQNNPLDRISTFRNFNKGLPFKGAFNNSRFVTAEGPFNPALVIKWLPLKDMSLKKKPEYSYWQQVIDNVRNNLKKGDRVVAVTMEETGEGERLEGIVSLIDVDNDNQRIRIFVQDVYTGDVKEVHPESLYRVQNLKESIHPGSLKKYVQTYEEYGN